MDEITKDFITVKELAKILELTPDAVRQMINKKTVEAVKINGAYLISKKEAERIITSRKA